MERIRKYKLTDGTILYGSISVEALNKLLDGLSVADWCYIESGKEVSENALS